MNEFSEQQIQEIQQPFKLYDFDMDGNITPNEIGVVLRSLGLPPSESEIEKIKSKYEKTQKISFDEFLLIYKNILAKKPEYDNQFQRAVGWLDKNKSGFIEIKELKRLLTSIGEPITEEEFNNFFKEFAQNKDGKISVEDFKKLFLVNEK
ncbi:ef-hand protein [Anaeramoeba ignava]|uniref:Ef-hand protein n=1 Tax=Anaeramoeba ignava TaxID=1746090 RepID=A0A9Q0LB51_ANAIG|nr:ef-hand protein [Anaeramoeba ignava]